MLLKDNERSYSIDLISFINDYVAKNDLKIKKAGGENTISSGRKKMFPDVVLYRDIDKTTILQGWEIKLPDTSITDEVFIKDAKRKAVALNLNSFFIWNFSSGVLYTKEINGSFKIEKQWNSTNHIKTRSDVALYKKDWECEISNILLEINEYLVKGCIKCSALGEIISNTVISTLILRNKKLVADSLINKARQNTKYKAIIDEWWKEFEKEYSKDEPCKYNAYSKIIILNWVVRVTFAHLIKKYHNKACMVDLIKIETSPTEANCKFDQITKHCDFYSIFSSLELNDFIPTETWYDIIELNEFLAQNGIKSIKQESLQIILEKTVSVAKREVAGQYPTPKVLAKILSGITITNPLGNVIDPCCGSGTIAKEIFNLKKDLDFSTQESIETTWASDKYQYPLQITNVSLTSFETIKFANRIFKENVFSLPSLNEIEIVNPSTGDLCKTAIPKFDFIVSNLPFIAVKSRSEQEQIYIKEIIEEIKNNTGNKLSDRSDIYCFIIFALHKVLNENGRAGFILSNSWFGTSWGKHFFKALNYYFYVEQIHISKYEKWFKNAEVVTVILILRKKQSIEAPKSEENVLFYSWKTSLEFLSENKDLIKSIVNSSLLAKNTDKDTIELNSYSYDSIEKMFGLNISFNAFFHNVEWIYDIKDSLIPLNNVFDVIRGERRGWDEMFYPQGKHSIEKKYIKKVLKNAKGVRYLIAEPDCDAFCCSNSKDELFEGNDVGALTWIERFENQMNNAGKLLSLVLRKKDMHWYEMSDSSTADITTMMNPNERLFFAKFKSSTFINQRLIGLRKKEDFSDVELNHALLNSIVGMFYIEAVGFGRGQGVLDINKDSISNSFMLNPTKVSATDREIILEKFKIICEREIKNTKDELEEEDRINFDKAVLDAFDITNYYNDIKKSLLSMQSARLSVNKERK